MVSCFRFSKERSSASARFARSVFKDCSYNARVEDVKKDISNADVLSACFGLGGCCLATGIYVAVAGLFIVKAVGVGLLGCVGTEGDVFW